MKGKKTWQIVGLSLLAALLITAGLFSVVRVYRHYREDMLAFESRHINSIVSGSARGLDWILNGYSLQLDQLLDRREVAEAEESYVSSGDPRSLRELMARPDLRRFYKEYLLAVYDVSGSLLAQTESDFPLYTGDDEALAEQMFLRSDDDGIFWLIFRAASDRGPIYELAVPVQTVFSHQAEATRVGRYGFLFMTDVEGRFISYSGGGASGTMEMEEFLRWNPSIDPEDFAAFRQNIYARPDDYQVIRYSWELFSSTEKGTSETLVMKCPLNVPNGSLMLCAAISFREFNSFLSDALHDVTRIILMEIGGALILFFIAARMLVQERRNRLELQAVRERADLMEDINRQQQSLAHTERLQQLGVMTSGIVHEFNNMLTPIMSQSMLLLEEMADREDSPEFESALDIYEASENAREMLRRMSGMGKKDVGQYHVLDLGQLLRRTMNLSALAKDPHIVQEIVLQGEPIYIRGVDQLLTQAFLNICINACQAMGSEGKLTITAAPEMRSGRAYARVDIRDTGPGIEEENVGSIYDPYFTTKGEQGTGLGLAICKKIIENHMGTISAVNHPDGGAVFTVRIPISEEEPE